MKVVLLCREGAIARRLARMLSEHGLLDAVVAEDGSHARAQKMSREWARTAWWRAPLFGLDLVALAIYGTLWSREVKKRLAAEGAGDEYPVGVPVHPVGDANDARCVALLRDLTPDVLVVFGTAIRKRPVLDTAREAALNVHGGVVPKYRNVHSEVWAVLNGDTERVGSSILPSGLITNPHSSAATNLLRTRNPRFSTYPSCHLAGEAPLSGSTHASTQAKYALSLLIRSSPLKGEAMLFTCILVTPLCKRHNACYADLYGVRTRHWNVLPQLWWTI